MKTKLKYGVGEKVITHMGTGVIVNAYMAGCNEDQPAYIVDHGYRNPRCPTWEYEIKGNANPTAASYSR